MAYSVNTYSVKKWNLDELFPGFDSPELQGAFENVEEQVASFEGVRGKLSPDIDTETFLTIVRASEEATRLVNKMYAFAGLSFAADTQDQNAQSLIGRVQQFVAEIQNRTLFFNLWWKDLDEANAERLMNASGDYRYYLEAIRKFPLHRREERLHDGVIVTIAAPTHTAGDAMGVEPPLIIFARIGTALVGMVQQTHRGTAPCQRHLERFQREVSVVDGTDRPANNIA